MPYMLVSTQIRLENGPTNVGDEYSDPDVMNYLGAKKTTMLGNNFSEYHVDEPPRLVLDKLEKIGFRLLSMTGVGQTLAGATCGCEGGYVPDKFLAGTGDFPGLRVVAWKPNADYKTPKEASKK